MFTILWSSVLLSMFSLINTQKEGLIVGGELASIIVDPHAAHIKMRCPANEGKPNAHWMCGSSVLNQRILVTAGHCLINCKTTTYIVVSLGDENKESGIVRSSSGFLVHAKYKADTYESDIALVKMSRPVDFSSRIKRVAIMRNPPYKEMAHVAGWGIINERKESPVDLKSLTQKVWKHVDCSQKFSDLPRGTICASHPSNKHEYAAEGDSGSGLLVREYILIGIVSYKSPNVDISVIMYTDVGYYYPWISYSATRLFCHSDSLG